MTRQGGQAPGLGGGLGSSDDEWDDWDPARAHRGYTSRVPAVPALRDLDTRREPRIDLPTPLGHQRQPGDGLSPAALAISARAETSDYLTVEYNPREPGFAELYDALIVPQWSVPFGRMLLSAFLTLPRGAGWQVLDVACGTGYPTLELARFLGADCDVAGIDVWEEAVQIARRKAADEWLRNVTFLSADILHHTLPDGTFDTITCNLGLPSFADRPAALGAMWRLLRPKGQLLLTLPLQPALREFLDTYYLTLRELRLDDYVRAFSRLVAERPTIEQARKLVEGAGFAIQRELTESFVLRFPTPLAFLRSPLVQTTYMASLRAVVPDETVRRLVFNEVERRLQRRIEASGGELRMTVPMLCLCATRM
jgi:arsenite methyltransferase